MDFENLLLQWNGFERNMSDSLQELRKSNDFLDVTLICQEQKLIPAHKVVLAASSSWFYNVLKQNPHQYPLLYLRGVSHDNLQALLHYMYVGEVTINQENVGSFLSVAQDLGVKGLSLKDGMPESISDKKQLVERGQEVELPTCHTLPCDENNTLYPINCHGNDEEEVEFSQFTFDEENNGAPISYVKEILDGPKTIEEMHGVVRPCMKVIFIDDDGHKAWKCLFCEKVSKRKATIERHIEAKHKKPSGLICPVCSEIHANRHALKIHFEEKHREKE